MVGMDVMLLHVYEPPQVHLYSVVVENICRRFLDFF